MSNNQGDYEKHLLEIMARYKAGNATEQEIREIDQWYDNVATQEKYADGMSPAEKLQAQHKIFQRINTRIYKEAVPANKVRSLMPIKKLALAAVIILIAGGTSWFYFANDKTQSTSVATVPHDLAPGGNKAFLTLGNGKRISLTDAANGKVAEQAGASIQKTADGKLVYGKPDGQQQLTAIEYNTVETPKGGQYQVHLPDGTSVWLNAASSLKYPASFASLKDRKVVLTGEAYFEVAKDKTHPFIVASGEQEVTVLGTHFNINAYSDEPNIKTTLLEGSVEVSDHAHQRNVTIKPDEQVVNDIKGLDVVKVRSEYVIAWKDGYFRFNGKTLEAAMKEIARWYDVTVVFKNPELKNKKIGGTISKYSTIKQVLKKMEIGGTFHFSIQDRQVIINN